MSFAGDIKAEIALNELEEAESTAELSALIQMTSSLSISSRGLTLVCTTQNAGVARLIYRLCRDRYDARITPAVKRRVNLKKNLIYTLRIEGDVKEILSDLGLYSAYGLRDRPLMKVVARDSCARAYLAGAFMAQGSCNSPETSNYHLDILCNNRKHAEFIQELMDRFGIDAKLSERRGHDIVYVKAAEKIGDFLRVIGADRCLMEFEEVRIDRDLASSITRLNNVEVANVVRVMKAGQEQLEDIAVLEEYDIVRNLDERLMDIIDLRKRYPETSLSELAEIYEEETGNRMSKSGLKHRFVKLHELRVKAEKDRKERHDHKGKQR